jgi:hypothetical protein
MSGMARYMCGLQNFKCSPLHYSIWMVCEEQRKIPNELIEAARE